MHVEFIQNGMCLIAGDLVYPKWQKRISSRIFSQNVKGVPGVMLLNFTAQIFV